MIPPVPRCVLAIALGLLAGCARFEPRPLSSSQTAAALEHRSLADPQLRHYLETNLHRGFAEWPLRVWGLEELSLAALYFHPSLDLARAQSQTASAAVQTARSRPNPVLSVVPGYSVNPPSGVSPWFPAVSLDVPIETAGKRGYREAQARHLADAASLHLLSTAWRVRSQVRASLLELVAAGQRAAARQRQADLERRFLALLEQRSEVGALPRSDLTPARLALAALEAQLADARRQQAESRAALAEAMGLPVGALADLEFVLPAPPGIEGSASVADARRQALWRRADVLAGLAEYAAAESALQLEVAKQFPDIHFGPGYQFDQGESKWSLGLAVELPVLNRNQGPIAEARARREEAAARFLTVQAGVLAEIDRALTARAAATEQLARQNQITQLARDRLASVQALVNAGAADQLDLVGAQLEAAAAELAALEARLQLQRAEGQLADALQRPPCPWPPLQAPATARASP